jgi:putative nucleotidyltransferase with HDIG domain
MKRVLFVDDEIRILEGLEDMLRRRRGQWTMRFALGAEAALEALGEEPFDIVVSDMRMPGMDGAELLRLVRDNHPDAIRIILSGHTEEEAALRAIPVAHQFVAKPCSREVLEGVIDRTCGLRDLLGNEAVRRAVTELGRLPSLPRAYADLTHALEDPEVTTEEVAEIVGGDVAMCAKLLQLANSDFFGIGRPISQVSHAVSYLGLGTVRALALTFGVFESANGGADVRRIVERLQDHAFRTAALAAAIADAGREEAFPAGLLHDIGKLVLTVCRPSEYARSEEIARAEKRPLHDVETGEMSVSHAEVGAYLLGLWGLPDPVVEAVAFHHWPSNAGNPTWGAVGAVHVADALRHEREGAEGIALLDLDYLHAAGVASRLPEWRRIAGALDAVAEESR